MPQRFGSRIQRFAHVVASIVLLGGCEFEPTHADLIWTEPVRLASGETVRVRRHVVLRQDRSLSGGTVSAPVFEVSSVEILDSANRAAVWDAPVVPLVLDKDPQTGEWVIVTGTDSCEIWRRNGMPRPPYWAFRLRGGKWLRDAIPESFLDRAVNLFAGFSVRDDSKDLDVGLNKDKSQMIAQHPGAEQFTAILRSFPNIEKCGRAVESSIEYDFVRFRRAS
jgi:hypothetical protein